MEVVGVEPTFRTPLRLLGDHFRRPSLEISNASYIIDDNSSSVNNNQSEHLSEFFDLFHLNSTFNNMTGITSKCSFKKHDWLEEKFFLISLCGTSIAVMGIISNIITAFVLTRPSMRSPNNMYLTTLAVFDACVLITAVGLYSIEYIFEYTDNIPLYETWITYVSNIYAVSHIAQTGSAYITVAVTIERYVAVVHPERSKMICGQKGSAYAIFWVICFAILFNCTKFFEIDVAKVDNCTGFAAYELVESSLVKNDTYSMIYSLWITQMVMVFIPFLVLLIFNTIIAVTIRKSLHQLSWIQRGKKRDELKEKSREATYVLIVIVLLFLICNSWGFVMALMERVYGVERLRRTMPAFYTFSREAINFLTIVNSSVNFIIYCIFGKDFRRELVHIYGCSFRFTLMMPMEDKFTARRLLVEQASEIKDHLKPSAILRYKPVVPNNLSLDSCFKTKNRLQRPKSINVQSMNLSDLDSTIIANHTTNGEALKDDSDERLTLTPQHTSTCTNGSNRPSSTPTDPFAPFLLGVMISAAPTIKNNASSESPAIKIFYNHEDIYWV